MRKNTWILFMTGLTFFIFALIQGCKSSPSAPVNPTATPVLSSTVTPTLTATPTITLTSTNTSTFTATNTVTSTITPDSGAKSYGFETNTLQSWQKDASAQASVSLAVSSAVVNTGSYSAVAGCAYSAGNDLVRIKRSFAGTPIYLRNASVSVFMYLSPAMFAAGTFHPEMTLVGYDGTALPAITNPDITVSGWFQAVFAVPDTLDYEMIGEVQIGLKNDLPTSYTDMLYFDDISW